jgi:hypothetical protein
MGGPSGSKTQLVKSVTGSFWKAKWAIKVEQEVAKLKADIGPLLEAISVLLQIESREQGAETHNGVKRLVNDVTSGFDRIMLAVQEQALANTRIDLQTTDMQFDMQAVVQQIPQLATSTQLGNLLSMAESISAGVGSTATKDQVDRSISPTQATAVDERQETLASVLLPSMKSPGIPFDSQDQSKSADSRIYYRSQSLLSSIYRLLASAVMALVLMFPNIQSQLRTSMTLLKSPTLLFSNSITVTDALNRTKLLPYEYSCNWAMFQPWLESAFEDLPGESRVRRGEFEMFVPMRDRTVPVLRGKDWKCSVFPGDRVVMSILSKRMCKDKRTRCGHVMSHQIVRKSWIEW